ncbi:unnamed protein product [Blepharisma stoltei]|uniref:Uncharacterized protein n=1 Tax=Blepharisma stoltei TaxID=1481888 RepID=A0AAU9JCB1_9CILI|nr:unnamed protein product [Blepharisma stoltei]
MSGNKLFQKLKELGFEDWAKSQGISPSLLPQNPQSLEWIFAFPRINNLLQWLLVSMNETQFLTAKELEVYEGLETKLDYESLQEIIELLDINSYKSDLINLVQPSLIEELQKQKQEQEQEIVRLQNELRNEEEIEISSLMTSLQSQFNESLKGLFETLEIFLKRFNSSSNVLSISLVQEYTSTDEQLSRLVIQYSKQIEEVVQAIDFSVHHHCLMSDRADEYTELCAERVKLQSLSLKNLEQETKASAAKQRYESALQALEDIVLREQKDKFLQDDIINAKTNMIKQELDALEKENEKIVNEELCSVIKEIAKLQAEENLSESHNELSDKRCEYEGIKLQEVTRLLEEQKKKHLLAMAGILLEQERVQSEYDCLFEIKTFLEDIKAQTDFRIDQYRTFRNRRELQLAERKTIDERDATLNELHQIIETQNQSTNLTYDRLIEMIQKVFEKQEEAKQAYKRSIGAILESSKTMLFESEKLLDNLDIIKSEHRADGRENYLSLSTLLKDQEQKLNKILLDVEQTRVNFKVSPSGLTERELFVEFLTTPENQTPRYLKDCEDVL